MTKITAQRWPRLHQVPEVTKPKGGGALEHRDLSHLSLSMLFFFTCRKITWVITARGITLVILKICFLRPSTRLIFKKKCTWRNYGRSLCCPRPVARWDSVYFASKGSPRPYVNLLKKEECKTSEGSHDSFKRLQVEQISCHILWCIGPTWFWVPTARSPTKSCFHLLRPIFVFQLGTWRWYRTVNFSRLSTFFENQSWWQQVGTESWVSFANNFEKLKWF